VKNLLLFATAALIWGSTWLAIKFQLGVVDPLVSIFYRFLLAAVVLLIYSYFSGRNLRYTPRQHLFMALQGILLFGVNYWLVYLAEMQLTSGLVAVVFSTIIFLNILNGAVILKSPVRLTVALSGLLGYFGVALLFRESLLDFSFSRGSSVAFMLALLGAFSASLGNIASAYNQKNKLPVIQTNAFGMLYGSLLMLLMAVVSGTPLNIDLSFPYLSSLVYLALFGSVIAFTAYLTLLGNVGADKAAYATLVIPVIALILSTVFEDFHWDVVSLIGVVLILMGNVLVMKRKKAAAA
jgi:drug/metabolite transporter (DMT)-like permease